MGCEQLLETDDMSALLYGDLCKSHCFFNISSLVFRTRYLNSGQLDQRISSPVGINFANANRLRMKCQDPGVFRRISRAPLAIEFFLIVFIMVEC